MYLILILNHKQCFNYNFKQKTQYNKQKKTKAYYYIIKT